MKLSEKIAIAIDGFVLCGGDIDIESLVILIEPHTAQLEAENGEMRVALKNIAAQAQVQYEIGIGTRAEAKYILDKCHGALLTGEKN